MASVDKGIALISGSAQGIGRGIALRLAKDGFDIALNDIPSKCDQLRVVADEIENMGRRTLLVPRDVTVEEEVKGMVQTVVDQFGGLDVMIANAGIAHTAPLVSTELDNWERVMTTNAQGVFLCYKYAAQQMIKQGRGGRIIGASSTAGKSATPLTSAYSASKFAVRGLTQAAALELGEHNITVNCYAPGLVETPMTAGMVHGGTIVLPDDDPLSASALKRMSLRAINRIGQPEDVANLVSFLASKEASLITGTYYFDLDPMFANLLGSGQCIAIDGGVNLS